VTEPATGAPVTWPPPGGTGPLVLTRWGRLFIGGAAGLALLFVWQQFSPLPAAVDVLRRLLAVFCLFGLAGLSIATAARHRRALLWRVRRKLILSYLFLGAVPLVLVLAFVLTGGMFLYTTIASYVFDEGLGDIVEDVRQTAAMSAIELGRGGVDVERAVFRTQQNLAAQYPKLSMVVVASGASAPSTLAAAGPWLHVARPEIAPAWVLTRGGFSGIVVVDDPARPDAIRLVARAAMPTPERQRVVIADVPLDDALVARLEERTGVRPEVMFASGCGSRPGAPEAPERRVGRMFSETVAYMDCTRWADGGVGSLAIRILAPTGALSDRLAMVRSSVVASAVGTSLWSVFEVLLVLLAGLFLVIQGAAVVLGGVLVRSITAAVHELFVGTERLRQGDFAHRIHVESRDQLGDLADSFNRMSESIEHLLLVQREKQRLDDELRIARDIQQSLLPVAPPSMAGLDIAGLCEPAREVGGDYYDFFRLGPKHLGVLVADVAGKGTSAALYMAELKGLMLALSQDQPSPRQLLVDVNRRLADHLDNRSFVTMTYAVLDLERGVLTSARAGHAPLIVASRGRADVIVPDGMVLGLRLPGASARFEEVLEEHVRPVGPGDVIALYTDGVTETMDAAGELFGDERLARLVESHGHLDAAGLRERVVRDVGAFAGDAEPHDDMTLLVIKLTEAP
jgi:sigma-B regulation protein RsbU (phosphoserine phosphatase)